MINTKMLSKFLFDVSFFCVVKIILMGCKFPQQKLKRYLHFYLKQKRDGYEWMGRNF
jgi:hypothetical protein